MNNATQYAKALHTVVTDAKFSRSDLLPNLRAFLERRGYLQLLPRIYTEYKKLELAKNRAQKHTLVTTERENTRILLELYRKLVS